MNQLEKLLKTLCPKGVEYKRLGEVGTFIRGNGLQKKDFTESGVGCIHYGQIYTHYGLYANETKSFVSVEFAKKLRKAKTGNLVIATTSENDEDVCKAVAWLGNHEIAVSGDAFIYDHTMDPKYVSYYFQSQHFQTQKAPYITGAKVRRVNGDAMEKIVIPIPPKKIQEEIVRILDAFSKLEAELEAELEARRKQYSHYRNTLLSFEDVAQINNNNIIKWMKLSDIADFRNGKGHEKSIDHNGKYIVVNSKFVSTDGRVRKYSQEQISPVFKDDILMVMSDLPNGKALAKCFLVDENEKYTLNQRICALTVKDTSELIVKFFYFILTRNRQLLKFDNGVDQTNLRKEDILDIRIPIPPIKEQLRIVKILDSFEALVNGIEDGIPAEIKARRQQYEYYRDQLLTFKEFV